MLTPTAPSGPPGAKPCHALEHRRK
jgi:hypothetical protein